MTQQDYEQRKLNGEIEAQPQSDPQQIVKELDNFPDFSRYLAVVELFRTQRQPLTAAPTFTPKNFAEQIQLYDTGGVRRLYVYVGSAWRYVTLT